MMGKQAGAAFLRHYHLMCEGLARPCAPQGSNKPASAPNVSTTSPDTGSTTWGKECLVRGNHREKHV